MYKIILKIFTIFGIALILCGSSCGGHEDNIYNRSWRIWVMNNSDRDVFAVLGFDLRDNNFYPTTQLPNDSTRLWRVKPGPDRQKPLDYSVDYKKFNLSDSIALFIFDPDTVAKYTWKQLGIGKKYLKKYGFKCDELTAAPSRPINYP